jgi:hypothetical protein
MLNEGFYPTPARVVDQMIKPWLQEIHGRKYLAHAARILEPSAGKGDIVDRLVSGYQIRASQVSCIESEPELQMILQGKGYALIDKDFLEFNDPYYFDLIIMNPPFANGVDHLLKAWDVLQGGRIVCLLNTESILNPHSDKRKKLAQIIKDHGRYEVIGSAFSTAERRTDVNIAIVWLEKAKQGADIPFDDDFERDQRFDENEFVANPLANNDLLQALVDQYNAAAKIKVEQHQLARKYAFYVKSVVSTDSESQAEKSLNEALDDLKKQFWNYVFNKTSLGQKATSNFRKKFDEFASQQARMAFSYNNVRSVLEMFFLNKETIMQQCIVEVFDKATSYSEDNIIRSEAWKTNKSWKIAPKIIIPYGVKHDSRYPSFSWSSDYHREDFFNDLDKALCFLTGQDTKGIATIYRAISERTQWLNGGNARYYQEKFCSTHFEIRIFKKGTVHLTFIDKNLRDKFNAAAAQGKNWVGTGK